MLVSLFLKAFPLFWVFAEGLPPFMEDATCENRLLAVLSFGSAKRCRSEVAAFVKEGAPSAKVPRTQPWGDVHLAVHETIMGNR